MPNTSFLFIRSVSFNSPKDNLLFAYGEVPPGWIDIDTALTEPGLRISLIPLPGGPWVEAIKGICVVKQLEYTSVLHNSENPKLYEDTAQTSFPVVWYNNNRPLSNWSEQLYFLEKLQPKPQLIPELTSDRIMMFGIANELFYEMGWHWRILYAYFAKTLFLSGKGGGRWSNSSDTELAERISKLSKKYGGNDTTLKKSAAKIMKSCHLFDQQLAIQNKKGSKFLIGTELSAADIYMASFCPFGIGKISEYFAPTAEKIDSLLHATDPNFDTKRLLNHRKYIWQEYLGGSPCV